MHLSWMNQFVVMNSSFLYEEPYLERVFFDSSVCKQLCNRNVLNLSGVLIIHFISFGGIALGGFVPHYILISNVQRR